MMTTNDLPQGTAQNTISLLLGHPDPTTLMTPEFREAMHSALSQPQAYRSLQYGPEQGGQELIDFLIAKVNREQHIAIAPENLMIVSGSTHAVDMIARLFAKPGDIVLVEAPSYVDSLHVFRDRQLELCSIPMDENGLITSELALLLERLKADGRSPAMLYTIPNFHNPTGITLSEARRVEIIRLAQQYGFLIVEDDVYRDLAFEGDIPASFYALANGKQILSVGSFSKTLAPGLRLGWLVGSADAIQRCVNCGTTQMGGGANPFATHFVTEYCRKGHWEPHVKRLRALYNERRDIALAALRQHMPDGVTRTHPAGGFFIWLTLPDHAYAQTVKKRALQRGVALAAGEGFFVNPADGAHNMRIAFSFAPPEEIEEGIKILSEVIAEPG
jgi:DNA-binding transcriptional MocR family regulator